MARNVEAKFQVLSHELVRARAAETAQTGPIILNQVDYFFPVPQGRLKLRIQESNAAANAPQSELISYERTDNAEARLSDYQRFITADPEGLRAILARSLGEGPVVRKRRELYLIEQTRVHLDTVEGLGCFVEIEVVLAEHDEEEMGMAVFAEHIRLLGLESAPIVEVAYADLLVSQIAQDDIGRTKI